jgi:tetratricopeptide (TPR) repeat protein
MLSVAYMNLREIEKARAEMFKTIQLKPDHIQTLYNLGLLYQLQGNSDEAAKWYLSLLKYEPGHLNANLNLAAIYLQSTQPEKAKPYLERVTRTYEEASHATTSGENRAHLLEKLAEICFKSGQLDKSEKALKEAIAADPKGRSLHFNLALIYQLGNQLPQAAAEYLAETKVDPKNYKAFFNLGVLYQSMNRLDDASDSFQEVLRITPGFQPAQERLAQIQGTQQKK